MMLNRIPVHQDKLWLVSLGSIKWTAQTVERNLYKALCFYRVGRHKIEYCRESRERRQELTLIFHSSLLKMLWSRFIFVLILAVVSARPSPELSLEEIEKGKLSCKTDKLYRSLIILLCSLVYTGFVIKMWDSAQQCLSPYYFASASFLLIFCISVRLSTCCNEIISFYKWWFIPIIQLSTRLLDLL